MQPVKVKSIKKVDKQDVYNMEVEKYHNFSVNGGIIIHNCIDGIRYGTEPLRNNTTGKIRVLGA